MTRPAGSHAFQALGRAVGAWLGLGPDPQPIPEANLPRVVALARLHGVLTPLSTQLGMRGAGTSDELRRAQGEEAATVLSQRAEYLALAEILAKAGIPWMAIKGVALSMSLYADFGVRGTGDIDLWIAPESLDEADRALRIAGYRRIFPDHEPDAAEHRWLLDVHNDYNYISPRGALIELHWRWHRFRLLAPLNFWRCHQRREIVEQRGTLEVATPTLQDHYVGVLTHAARSRWGKLKWICDAVVARKRLGPAAREIEERFDYAPIVEQLESLCRTIFAGSPPPHRMLGRTALKALVQEDRGTTVETSLGDFLFSPIYYAALRRNPAYGRSVFASLWLRRSNFEQAHLAAWPLWLVLLLRPLTYVWWRFNDLYTKTPVNSPPSVL